MRYGLESNGIITRYNSSDETITINALDIDNVYISISHSSDYASEYQMEIGTAATPYEEYKGVTLTIALGTTVYGGTLDVKTGVLTITDAIVDLGSMDWTFETWANDMYSDGVATAILKPTQSIATSAICTIFKAVSRDDIQTSTNAFCVNQYGRIIIVDPRYTDAAEFKTAVTGEKICYPLATPTTVQLTGAELEMLKGYNYISTDADSLTVKAYTI